MSVTMNRRTFVSAASAAALVGAMGASAAFATEIDTPAHSACFKAVVPELMLDDRHLDVSKPETVEFIKNLFDE